jgi:hypothetical protein
MKIKYIAKLFRTNIGVYGMGALIKIYFQMKVFPE